MELHANISMLTMTKLTCLSLVIIVFFLSHSKVGFTLLHWISSTVITHRSNADLSSCSLFAWSVCICSGTFLREEVGRHFQLHHSSSQHYKDCQMAANSWKEISTSVIRTKRTNRRKNLRSFPIKIAIV